MNPNAAIADACARAAGVIAERGWCQGHYQDEDGRVCLMGAVAEVVGIPLWHVALDEFGISVDMALNEAINASSMMTWKCNEDWNDFPTRDAREVIDLLEGVAWQYQIKAEAQKELALVG